MRLLGPACNMPGDRASTCAVELENYGLSVCSLRMQNSETISLTLSHVQAMLSYPPKVSTLHHLAESYVVEACLCVCVAVLNSHPRSCWIRSPGFLGGGIGHIFQQAHKAQETHCSAPSVAPTHARLIQQVDDGATRFWRGAVQSLSLLGSAAHVAMWEAR